MEQKVLRVGSLVVVGAIVLRLLIGFLPILSSPHTAMVLLFLQTGRVARPTNISFVPDTTTATEAMTTPPPTPTDPPVTPPQPEPELPVFSESDAADIAINSSFRYNADIPALLTQPLRWDLTGEEPKVLILHTHGS